MQNLVKQVNDYRKYIQTYTSELANEKKLKEDYAAKASKLLAWVSSAIGDLGDRSFDNTLAGAQV